MLLGSFVLCASWWPYCESLTLRHPKFRLASRCMIDLLLDQVVPSVSTLLELIGTSWAKIPETRRVNLIVVVVAQVDKPLPPRDPKSRRDWRIWVPTFHWYWTFWCLSWVIPLGIQSRQLWMIGLFFAYRRNFSDEIVHPSSSPWSSRLAS
jgi:hypothetical protein